MAFSKLIAFDRPLSGAVRAGQGDKTVSESEVAAKCQAAYHAGADAARAAANQQMVELRADMAQLSDEVLKRLSLIEPALVSQLREALPALALEIGRRLLAGFEPPPEVAERLWRAALEELYPERENLELSLCSRDATLIEELNPQWRQRYPGLRIRSDSSLLAGDCVVRSRFGLTDARRETKLAALEHALAGT